MPDMIVSFGYRHRGGPPKVLPDALVIDVRTRFTRNPYHNKVLRKLRGDHPLVEADILQTPGFMKSYERLKVMVAFHNGTVYLGCTGGHHRSVYLAQRLAKEFDVPVEHLDYDKP